ncbi:MAG: 50S ribosomal protein L25/general stress protein Ctc [Prevotella sp.]|jgi:ribosomal protein L25, ctc-form|uniref:50S ribosomal protein L25/general stress protein Ctc n=1 Tax=Alloprevotella sp. TaxID=1872471 RepID=UPI0015AB1424|nr:50S ribosomal protein L25/general stress protein Ctc [Prevotella sp.]MBD9035828.1 50S ribosomal protein L25/general stress protein Ctc [Prevotella sp.]MEE0446862.1 50S ribosomal protein L25/general stress protein Ctc [Prevotellamassilia sp.]
MKQISINGTARTELGKKAAKAIRNSGNVPCVLYGEKKDANGQPEAIHFSVSEKEINKLIYTPHIYLVDINIDGEDHKGILKEVQFHPVKDNVLHVDFLEVHAEKPIVMGVPIAPQGLAEGVRAGGRLITMVRKLNVKALYSAIPEKLNIDVTALQLGKSIKVGDLHFENLELVTPKEVIVCTVKMTRAAMGAAAAAAKA